MSTIHPKCGTCKVRSCSILSNCSPAILEEISNKKACRFVGKGEHLLEEGEEAKQVYFIRSGVVKVEANRKNGKSLILRLAGKGSTFGLRNFFSTRTYTLTVVAVEDLQVCTLNMADFNQMTDKCNDLRSAVMDSLLEEIRDAEVLAIGMVHKSVKERVAAILLHIAVVYQYRPGSKSIYAHLDRQEIADMAGTTKEQVSKTLAEFRKNKLINYRAKRFKFFDLVRLGKIAEE